MKERDAAAPALEAHEVELLGADELIVEDLELIVRASWRRADPLDALIKPPFVRDPILAGAASTRTLGIETHRIEV